MFRRPWRVVAAVLLPLVLVGGCSSPASTSQDVATVTDRKTVEAFVQEAVAFAREHGQHAALKEFSAPTGRFQRGELYVFAYDFDGNVLAHGGNPELVGQNLIDLTDANGKAMVRTFAELARKGSGWGEYVWPNPDHGNAEEVKFGYVAKVDDTWWLGTGTYAKAD